MAKFCPNTWMVSFFIMLWAKEARLLTKNWNPETAEKGDVNNQFVIKLQLKLKRLKLLANVVHFRRKEATKNAQNSEKDSESK